MDLKKYDNDLAACDKYSILRFSAYLTGVSQYPTRDIVSFLQRSFASAGLESQQ